MKVSLVSTIYNEEETIIGFLKSIYNQKKLPDEIILVDGGSTDNTILKISQFKIPQAKGKRFPNIKLIFKNGNRAIGRNEGIKVANGEVIVISDAGCLLDKNWISEIIKPFKDKKTDVVAGYYRGAFQNVFQKSLIPYVLVMEDKLNEKEFLPATRSMAIKKIVWKKVHGFNEKLSHNEDYDFAIKLKKSKVKIVFTKQAIVNWLPRKNLLSAFKMFFRFSLGDIQANILREKVVYIFLRYLFIIYLLILGFIMRSLTLWLFILSLFFVYVIWSIFKNYKYVRNIQALFYLPLIQFTSDLAVVSGSSLGFLEKISIESIITKIKNNKIASVLTLIYVILMLSVINFGIPNLSHPFTYHMDEWHQLNAVKSTFKIGSPNVLGSANGTMFQFFVSGIMLIPFIATKIIDTSVFKTALDFLSEQSRLFIVLRMETLFFGVLSLFGLIKISQLLKANKVVMLTFFIFSPLWLSFSNYFKYDIALVFWIVLSIYLTLKYSITSSRLNYVLLAIITGIAFAVKFSALPLFLLLVVAFIVFNPSPLRNYKELILGLIICGVTALFLGMPDTLFINKNIYSYLYANLIASPLDVSNFSFGIPPLLYLLTKIYPLSFGHSLYLLSIISILFYFLVKNRKINRQEGFLLISFLVFIASLYPLGIWAIGNRLLVLLPYVVILSVLMIGYLYRSLNGFIKNVFVLIIAVLLLIQIIEGFNFIKIKTISDPRSDSSAWITKNIVKSTEIGIENIPIYQNIPDFLLFDFYKTIYKKGSSYYNYVIINSKTKEFPNTIILTHTDFNKYLLESDNKDIVKRLNREGYVVKASFSSDIGIAKVYATLNDILFSSLLPVTSIEVYQK